MRQIVGPQFECSASREDRTAVLAASLSLRMAPSWIKATRWQRSASSIYGVATRIVNPPAARCASVSTKFPARNGIDAGGGFVQQQHTRLGNQGAH